MSEFEKQEQLIEVAMQIILHAGDSRTKVKEALGFAKKFDFENAEKAMEEAIIEVTEAHKTQTQIIQSEASGDTYPHSLLFAHAQDTLMTVNSELNVSQEIIDVLKIVCEKSYER